MSDKLPWAGKGGQIDPETAQEGDTIRVLFKRGKDGIARQREGVVRRRGDGGAFRTLYTEEGGELVSWKRPLTKDDAEFRVILVDRPPATQSTLSIFDNLSERII